MRTMPPRRMLSLAVLACALLACALLVLAGGGGGADDGSGANDVQGTPTSAAWLTTPITDVDGKTFTIAGLAGKPVFVEPFATWCSTCLAQLPATDAAAGELGDEAAFVVLSVETDLAADAVAAYSREHGFRNLRFAVMSPKLLAAIVADLGTTAANPPSTPHVIVAADGSVGELETGSKSADEIVSKVRAGSSGG